MREVILVAPSLDPNCNVNGISSVAQFIINNNKSDNYIHFGMGKLDGEKGGVHRIKGILKSLRDWRRLLRKHPDALIHYSFPLSAPSIIRDPVFMWLAYRRKMPMVVHIHGGLFLTAPKTPWLLKKILSWVFSWDTQFIVLSDMEVRLIKERYHAKKVASLPNCVDLTDANKYQRQYKPTGEPLILGYIGRIERNKGINELLEALSKLKENGVKFKFRLAGKEDIKGEFVPRFEEKLKEQFEFVGLVSGKTKTEYLQSIDMLVMPTYFEGLPMTLLECMSFGSVPVITPVGSIPEVIKDKENGRFIQVKDIESIVDVITHLNHNRDEIEKMGKAAKETIFTQFSPKAYIENLRNMYESTSINRI